MSSLIYLAFSVVAFIIIYGMLFTLLPQILGAFYSIDIEPMDPEWQQTQQETEDVTRWLIPIMPTIGMVILFLKVLMVASNRGRD